VRRSSTSESRFAWPVSIRRSEYFSAHSDPRQVGAQQRCPKIGVAKLLRILLVVASCRRTLIYTIASVFVDVIAAQTESRV